MGDCRKLSFSAMSRSLSCRRRRIRNLFATNNNNIKQEKHNIQFSESVVKYNFINFLNLLIDMGSLSGAGRLFHNIGPLNLIDRFPHVDCTEDTCKLLQPQSRQSPPRASRFRSHKCVYTVFLSAMGLMSASSK